MTASILAGSGGEGADVAAEREVTLRTASQVGLAAIKAGAVLVSWKQAVMLRRGSVGQFVVGGVGVAKLADEGLDQQWNGQWR
jgi:hypothetical protein